MFTDICEDILLFAFGDSQKRLREIWPRLSVTAACKPPLGDKSVHLGGRERACAYILPLPLAPLFLSISHTRSLTHKCATVRWEILRAPGLSLVFWRTPPLKHARSLIRTRTHVSSFSSLLMPNSKCWNPFAPAEPNGNVFFFKKFYTFC